MDMINKSQIWIHNSGNLLEIFAGDKFITDVNTSICNMDYAIEVVETLGYEVIEDDFTVRSIKKDEAGYLEESKNLKGSIGCLTADMDSDKENFYSSWNSFDEDKNTSKFKEELYRVIQSLRCDGKFLSSRGALAFYCYHEPIYPLKNGKEYGIRVDTKVYSFFMRLNPHKKEFNLHCYCYEKELLDRQIKMIRKNQER